MTAKLLRCQKMSIWIRRDFLKYLNEDKLILNEPIRWTSFHEQQATLRATTYCLKGVVVASVLAADAAAERQLVVPVTLVGYLTRNWMH